LVLRFTDPFLLPVFHPIYIFLRRLKTVMTGSQVFQAHIRARRPGWFLAFAGSNRIRGAQVREFRPGTISHTRRVRRAFFQATEFIANILYTAVLFDTVAILSRFRNCENVISVAAVEELSYRQSRLCRLLGNPVAFTVVLLLANSKDMSTGEIAKAIGRSVPRTSNILGALRLAEVVRYETEGKHTRYRLKHPREIRRILDALSGFVKTTSVAPR
jgi:DNA-binding transcriptional ArsR family regulator